MPVARQSRDTESKCDRRYGWKRGVGKCVRVTPEESGAVQPTGNTENAIILKAHQERVRERLRTQDGLILDHGLGSGKTISAIAAAEDYGGAVVVTPAALRENFKKELRAYKAKGKYDVMSYEGFIKDRPDLSGRVLIIDEAHRLANSSTKRTQAISEEAQKASKRILLTATPLQNRPQDASTLVNIAAGEKILPVDEGAFRRQYLRKVGGLEGAFDNVFRGVPTYGTYKPKNLDDYRKKVSRYVDFYAPNAEGFPTVSKHVVNIPMSKQQARAQEAWLKEMPSDMRQRIKEGQPPESGDISRLNTFMNATRQTANTGAAYGAADEIESPKITAIVDRVASSKGKSLIYSNYIDSGIAPLERSLQQKNIKSARLTGGLSDEARAQLVRDYNDDKIKTLIISSAGGEGLDLKRTEQIHVMEPHWNDEKINQVIGRGVRYRSHDGLPQERQHVDVYRYVSVFPDEYFLFWKRYGGLRTADEYLTLMSDRKRQLNQKFLDSYRLNRDSLIRADKQKAKCDPDHGWEQGQGKCVRVDPKKRNAMLSTRDGVRIASIAAATAGLTVGGYMAARARYRANIPSSAEMAMKRSFEIDPETLPDFTGKEAILLAQPGFSGFLGPTQARSVEKIMERGFKDMAGDRYGVFMLPNEKFNVYMPDYVPPKWNPNDMRTYRMGPGGDIEPVVPAIRKMLKTTLAEGRNPQSIEATAYILAMERKFRLQNPGKDPVMKAAGYSAGGMILSESNMQLKHLGKKVDMLFMGAPYYGITDQDENIVRVGSRKDPAMKFVPHGKTTYFDEVEYHAHYQDYPGVRSFITGWLKPRKIEVGDKRGDSLRFDRRPPAKCDPRHGWQKGPTGKCVRSTPKEGSPQGKKIAAALNDYQINPETGRPYKIRELRGLAREKGVVGYGSMTTEQMRNSMRLIDSNPSEAQRQNVVKTFGKDRSISTRAINAGLAGVKGRTPAEKRLIKDLRSAGLEYKRFEALMKFAGSAPVKWSVLGAAAWFGGRTIGGWNRVKDDYRAGIKESATIAASRVPNINVRQPTASNPAGQFFQRGGKKSGVKTGGENITFVVGGKPSASAEMIEELKKGGQSKDSPEGEKWLSKNNFVSYDLKESGVTTDSGGLDEATQMMGDFMRNRNRGRNQDSVDLAATIFAHATAYPEKKINIVSHGAGGLATKEALEILSKMEVKRGNRVIKGVDLVQSVNVVLLGTPHFGYTEPVAPNTRTVTSPNDPFSKIPFSGGGVRPQWISSVKGHSAKDYLTDPSVRESLRESFGYYRTDSKAECDPDHGWRDGPGKCLRSPGAGLEQFRQTQAIAKGVEAKIANQKIEHVVILSKDGKLIGHFKGEKENVRIPEEEYKKIVPYTAGGIVTHNHPDPVSFSLQDLGFACAARVRQMRVVTGDSHYSIEKADGKNFAIADFPKIAKSFHEHRFDAMIALRARVEQGSIKSWTPLDHSNELWSGVSKELGFIYRREPRDKNNGLRT